jgi:hypothetical protein
MSTFKTNRKSKYSELNLLDDSVISRSLFNMHAKVPRAKNNKVGVCKV